MPSDTLHWQRSESTWAQVMACYLTSPSHYLNHCLMGAITVYHGLTITIVYPKTKEWWVLGHFLSIMVNSLRPTCQVTPHGNRDLAHRTQFMLPDCRQQGIKLISMNQVPWHSCEGNFSRDSSAIQHQNQLGNDSSKFSFRSPRDQWVKPDGDMAHPYW